MLKEFGLDLYFIMIINLYEMNYVFVFLIDYCCYLLNQNKLFQKVCFITALLPLHLMASSMKNDTSRCSSGYDINVILSVIISQTSDQLLTLFGRSMSIFCLLSSNVIKYFSGLLGFFRINCSIRNSNNGFNL